MNSKNQNTESVGIIGSADGPTAVYISGNKEKIFSGIRRYIYNCRYRKAERKIVAGTHTLEEVAVYAEENFGAIKQEGKQDKKAGARYSYEIKIGDGLFVLETDFMRDDIGVSFSGSKKEMKYFEKIAKELYIYYGVSEKDIREKTERYFSLLNILTM